MDDKIVWKSIGGKNFCSFKMRTRTETFCKNANNVTGICNEASCPLANSHYATVREEQEALYLYIKVPERVNRPSQAYEKIRLSDSYEKAILEVERNLKYWDCEIVHKCKQRLTKLTLYLRRKKSMNERIEIKAIKKKQTRKEKVGAMKALSKVNFEKNIEEELYRRLESGIYGVRMKDKFEKRDRVFEFEESDDDGVSFSKAGRGKGAKKIAW